MQAAVAVPFIEEAIISLVGVWERHGNVSLVQWLVLMTANLAS